MNSNGNLMENIENRTNRVNNNYANYNYNISNSNRTNKTIHKIKNNLARTTQVEMEKENNQFVKNNNDEYNNIFFYTSNTNKNTNPNYNNEINENKYKYQYREKSDYIYNALDDDDNNTYNNNNNINLISNKKENKMKKKFIYKKSGNWSDNKVQKLISNKNNSQSKPSINNNNNNESQNVEKLQNNLTKGKKTINRINKNVKRDKSNEIIPLKNKRSYEIKKRQFKENKNVKNYTIKKHEMKLRKKKSFDSIDIKIKVPPDDREEIISIDIKKDNVSERIQNIIKEFSLDESYYEPLLSLVNNSINILNNIDNMKIYKSVKNENEKLGEESEEVTSSETNNLDLSVIIDLIEKNKFKEYIEDIYSDNEEIVDNAKILNLSI
jgi:hypothetical protein